MNNFKKDITVVIVSFQSGHIIEKCIKSINSSIKIVIVENSNNIKIKNYLEYKFSNVEVIIARDNLGYGKGNNLGISKVNTKYAFILNPDVILEKNCLNELFKAQLALQGNFSILAPTIENNYVYFLNQNQFVQKEIFQVDYVKGFAMLINLKKINLDIIFDENFFLFLEEIDLCKRIKDNGGKIFIARRAKVQHLAKQASGDSLNIDLCRNWHWMWSLFYYNNKHFGTLTAYRITIGKFFSSIFKSFFFLIFFNKKKFLIHYYRLKGLFNAFLKKPAWFRPDSIY
jgi:N-acetylglucosaminyl-diphospho-decaprenol L-rhamnosyltransferase